MWRIISNYISALIMLFGVLIFSKMLLAKKIQIKKGKLLFMIITISILEMIVGTNVNNIIKPLVITLLNIVFIKYVFDENNKKSFFIIFLQMLILIFVDTFLYCITDKIKFIGIYNCCYGEVIKNIISIIVFLFISYLIKEFLRKLIETKISNNLKVIIYSSMTLISVLILFYNSFTYIFNNIDIVIGIFLMIFFSLIMFSLIKQIVINNKKTSEYDNLLNRMARYEIDIETSRIMRHETKNELRTIRAMIADKQQTQKAIDYIDDMLEEKYEIKDEKYAKFGYLPPNGIKGLCYFKIHEAEYKGINVSINISKKITKSTIYNLSLKQQRDFGRILGVVLDNAIEASFESEKKLLGLEAYINEKKEFKLIISNTYKTPICTEKIGKINYSSKGAKRGYGLLLVNQLVEKNNNFVLKNVIDENIYVQEIEIKKNNSIK